MQDDPSYLKMVEKSFIMNKYHQKHPRQKVPQVKKEPTILHKVLTTGVLSSLIHLIAFPFDTIKVRKMARNRLVDVARFDANKVIAKSTYLGFFKGYLSIIIGNMCFLTFGQESFLLGVVAEGVLKTWIDISKISSQMANESMRMDIARRIFLPATFYSVARDLTSRGSYMLLVDTLFSYYRQWLHRDMNRRYHVYFGSAIVASLLSHPFDVIFTKLASQRQHRFKGLLGSIKTIAKDEGFGKFYSGMSYRLIYSFISLTVMGNCYDSFMLMALEAF